MPETPSAQAPSVEEQKLSSEPLPQPSEADLDKEVVEKQEPTSDAEEDEEVVPYGEGDVFNFTSPAEQSYSIVVVKVEGKEITLQNSTPGAAPITVPYETAKEILESPARV